MPEEMVYDACLELRPDGTCTAQLRDMPACFTQAHDEAQAITFLEAELPAYFEWLARHDEYTPVMHGPFHVVATETLKMPSAQSGVFFESDALPLSADDLDWNATLLDWSYQDYEAQLATHAAADTAASQAANRLCEMQTWLLSRLAEADSAASPPLPRLLAPQLVAHIHRLTLERVRGIGEGERERTLDHDGERWSLRKVLRRSILLVRAGSLELTGTHA